MTEEVDNLILEHLRHIRSDIAVMKDDLREIKQRPGSLESAVAGLKRDNPGLCGDIAEQPSRFDRLVERVEHIERRLDRQDEI